MLTRQSSIHICPGHSYMLKSTLGYSTISTQILSRSQLRDCEGDKSHATNKFIVYCNAQITRHGRNGNIEEAELIFSRMPSRNIITWTALLTAYAGNGQLDRAREVFDEMPERSVASWNAMITAYSRNNCMVDEAYGLFSRMPERNEVSYAAMVTGFVRAGIFHKAEKLYNVMPRIWRDPVCSNALISGYLKAGELCKAVLVFEGMTEKDLVSWSSMVDGHCKLGRVNDGRNLFDMMPVRNVVSWSAMIDGYMKSGNFEDGFGLFLSMRKEGVWGVGSMTLTIVFEACAKFGRSEEGIQIHGLVSRMGCEYDVFLGNSIINMYGKFGCTYSAAKIFRLMTKRDLVSWNSLIASYVQADKMEEAYDLFEMMPERDVVSWTTMIRGYSCKGDIANFMHWFNVMPNKDDVAWTAVISGLVNNKQFAEAIHWYILMTRQAFWPNALTLSSVISASASLATLVQGSQIHTHAVKMDMEFDLSVRNSLVTMYSKCGNISDSYRIFRYISVPNIVSYNSMITGFAQHGLAQEALHLFSEMKNVGQQPNQITFLALLSACTHMGLVQEGKNLFESMRSTYQIEPGPDHYACMVNLLGRLGCLDEAIDMIHSMPFEAHSGIWGALLGASRFHLRPDLAKLAAEHILKLDPDNATPYLVLSDIYHTLDEMNWEQVKSTKVRKGVKKCPGCSWIVVRD
ncbi:hypothetical protein Nepgr_007400 [Nepenthes gracilis]|uniref:Pentatricopeptide repeat-containing protein n=1 Tax=Nepenthes gracilis TaxID=150966 RepID=A0AAD3S6W5_NEPGR|nr:hypothetical protein Nepgr_007400 [Nepenthes gracilis]